MEKNNTRINYDYEEDILSFSKGNKVISSVDIGDFVIDIDTNNLVSGLEILNSSENLKLSREQLKKIQKVSMIVTYKPNYVYIYLVIKLKNIEKNITMPFTIDLGHKTAKTENINFAVA